MQAVKIRGLGRLLTIAFFCFLSQTAFGTQTVIKYYEGCENGKCSRSSTLNGVCAAIAPAGYSNAHGNGSTSCRATLGGTYYVFGQVQYFENVSCPYGHTNYYCNSSCEAPNYLNEQGQCVPPPDCSAGETEFHLSPTGINRSSPSVSWPSGSSSPTQLSICSGSCSYSYTSGGNVTCGSLTGGDPLVLYCLFKYTSTGAACTSADAPLNIGTTPPVPPQDPNDPTDPANNCGPTHVWSGSTCVPKLNNDNSSDNPSNPGHGGNNGGSNGGGSDGGNNGSDGGSGNGSGGGGGAATDVSGVEDRLDKLWGSFFDQQYNNEGDGNDADTQIAASDAANSLINQFGDKGDSVLAERLEESQNYLDGIPNTVAGWFGSSGEAVGLYRVLDVLLPTAIACSDYNLKLNLGRYTADLVIPTCQLTRVKPLLEYVIWCITIVGLWKILYSGLRQEDSKHQKGSF